MSKSGAAAQSGLVAEWSIELKGFQCGDRLRTAFIQKVLGLDAKVGKFSSIMKANTSVSIDTPCSHVNAKTIRKVDREGLVCEECVKIGSDWVHLRFCLECGHVGCCDQSPHRHARAHFNQRGHPLITSGQPDENWSYCFADDLMLTEDF